ncbi:MAG: hypothetical protein Q9184_004611 [Pyrenodesmia sp. 2 TL-2023]
MRPRTNVWGQFDELGHDGIHTHKRVKCKHCGHEIIAQASKMEHHLRVCKLFDGPEEFRQPVTPAPRRQQQQQQQPAIQNNGLPVPNVFQIQNNSGCSVCGNMLPVKKCARCRETQYCSVNCQKLDWKSHKEFCGMPALIDG